MGWRRGRRVGTGSPSPGSRPARYLSVVSWAEVLPYLGIAVMLVALGLVPLGLPGVWIMVVVLLLGAAAGEVAWLLWTLLALLTLAAEIVELVFLKVIGERFGGSRKAFWGAVAGGFVGAVVGVPVPVLGPLLGGFLGTFVGAGAVTVLEGGSLQPAARVGWGAVLARTVAVGVKVGVGIVVLVAGGMALVV